ncbi:MAG: hypothetical protein ACEQSD_05090 [Flavobacteriales bacterium]
MSDKRSAGLLGWNTAMQFYPVSLRPISLRESLQELAVPFQQPLSSFAPVRKVRARVRQELEQHRDIITESQSRLDKLIDSARRHSEAQPALIHEPLEQAIDWFDQLQEKVGDQLAPSSISHQSPWCGSVDKRLRGLAPVAPSQQRPALTPKAIQQGWQAMWHAQVAQTVAKYPAFSGLTHPKYRILPTEPAPDLLKPLSKLTRLPLQLRETRDQLQRQVDRLIGVRPSEDVWETQFPEDEDRRR